MKMIRDGFPVKIVLKADRNGNGFVLSKKIKTIDALKDMKTIIAVPHLFPTQRPAAQDIKTTQYLP